MIASPWVLSQQNTVVFDGTQVIDVAMGAVLVALAVVSLLLLALSERYGDRESEAGDERGH
ncbi:MAG TPA: hypothetical protein VLG91_13445 [Streptomyces sp.]|nr:hypothetical protein [Streptomyces sp.]